jgi:hypothetical protein
VITVKPNQPKWYAAIVKPTPTTKPRSSWSWTPTGPGHEVKCRLKVYPAPTPRQSPWAGLQQVIRVNRQGEREGKFFDTITYYITTETRQAYALAPTLRGHRQIENHRHWVKEVIFKEDHCGIRLFTAASCHSWSLPQFRFQPTRVGRIPFPHGRDTNGHRPEWSVMEDDNYPQRKILYSRHQLTVLISYLYELQIPFLL